MLSAPAMRLDPMIAAALCAMLIAGCEDIGPPSGTVSGRVTIGDRAPTEPVRVQFVNPLLGDGGAAITEADGTFKLDRMLRVGDYVIYVERVLDKHGGSVVRAAAASGIARRYFQIVRARSSK